MNTIYHVRLILSRTLAFEVDAVEGLLMGQDVQCLLGRDILQQLKFIYDGPNNRFSLILK